MNLCIIMGYTERYLIIFSLSKTKIFEKFTNSRGLVSFVCSFLMGRFWCREARVDDPVVVVVLLWVAWMCHHSSSHLIYLLHFQPMLSPMMTSPLLLCILSELLYHYKQNFDQIRIYKIFYYQSTRPGHNWLVKTNTPRFASAIYKIINDYRRDSPARAMPTIISTCIHMFQWGRKKKITDLNNCTSTHQTWLGRTHYYPQDIQEKLSILQIPEM